MKKDDRYAKEKQRVNSILNDKYKNDEEYREECKERSRLYRLKKKNDINNKYRNKYVNK